MQPRYKLRKKNGHLLSVAIGSLILLPTTANAQEIDVIEETEPVITIVDDTNNQDAAIISIDDSMDITDRVSVNTLEEFEVLTKPSIPTGTSFRLWSSKQLQGYPFKAMTQDENIEELVKNATALVVLEKSDNTYTFGSATLIGAQTYVTAAHTFMNDDVTPPSVEDIQNIYIIQDMHEYIDYEKLKAAIDGPKSIKVTPNINPESGEGLYFYNNTDYRAVTKNDLALIHINNVPQAKYRMNIKPLELYGEKPIDVGTHVTWSGYPALKDNFNLVGKRYTNNYDVFKNSKELYFAHGETYGGASGAGVYTDDNKIVGIVGGYLDNKPITDTNQPTVYSAFVKIEKDKYNWIIEHLNKHDQINRFWDNANGDRYYINDKHELVTGDLTVSDVTYTFDNTGKLINTTKPQPEQPINKVEEPVVEKPTDKVEEPIVEKPSDKVEEPVIEKPIDKVEEPIVEKPTDKVEDPIVEKPTDKVEEPAVEKPIDKVDEPIVEKPTDKVEDPVVEKPIDKVEDPIVEKPTDKVDEPVAEKPTDKVEESVVEKPIGKVEEPVIEKPVDKVEEPVVEKPIDKIEEPVIEKPIDKIDEPIVEKPINKVDEPIVEKPTNKIDEPVVEQPIDKVEEPVVEKPTDKVEEPIIETAIDKINEPVIEKPISKIDESIIEKPIDKVEETIVEQPTNKVKETIIELPNNKIKETIIEQPNTKIEETTIDQAFNNINKPTISNPIKNKQSNDDKSNTTIASNNTNNTTIIKNKTNEQSTLKNDTKKDKNATNDNDTDSIDIPKPVEPTLNPTNKDNNVVKKDTTQTASTLPETGEYQLIFPSLFMFLSAVPLLLKRKFHKH